MGNFRNSSAYFGSPDIQTSTENQEIIQQHKPSEWSIKKLTVSRFNFYNEQNCHIKINEGEPIFIRAGQGFEMDMYDGELISFIIVEENINYNYMGNY